MCFGKITGPEYFRPPSNPSNFEGDRRPVEQVSWYEAIEFCQRLSKHTRRNYRLPSEAEWAWAARSSARTRTTTSDSRSPGVAARSPVAAAVAAATCVLASSDDLDMWYHMTNSLTTLGLSGGPVSPLHRGAWCNCGSCHHPHENGSQSVSWRGYAASPFHGSLCYAAQH